MTLPVSVVIPAWNSADSIVDCLRSLRGQGHSETIVVDNGSTDDTPSLVHAHCPEATLLSFKENAGFCRACNRGIAQSRGEFVLLLNDDARLEPGYLRHLCETLEAHPRAATAVGKLVTSRAGQIHIDSAGIDLCAYALRPLDRGHGERDRGQYDEPGSIFGPSAAAALYRRSALAVLDEPPFDEQLFAYYEDVDLAWRLSRAGWSHRYVPQAMAFHSRRGPEDKPPSIRARAFANRYIVWAKNEAPLRFLSYAPLALGWESVRLLKRTLSEREVLAEVPGSLWRVFSILRNRL
jgi:GT2 family glycosyltransferase